jgi:hypothetical protein
MEVKRESLWLIVWAKEIGRESACACRCFDASWEKAIHVRAVGGLWDAWAPSLSAAAGLTGERKPGDRLPAHSVRARSICEELPIPKLVIGP